MFFPPYLILSAPLSLGWRAGIIAQRWDHFTVKHKWREDRNGCKTVEEKMFDETDHCLQGDKGVTR